MSGKTIASTEKKPLSELTKTTPKDRIAECVASMDHEAALIKRTIGIKKGTVLDAGCGGAYIDIALAQNKDLDFILLDPAHKAAKAAEENMKAFGYGSRAQVICGSEQEIPLKDNTVDYVISTSSIGYWHNAQKGLEECYRVVKPGGKIFVSDISWDSYRDYFGMLKQSEIEYFSVHNEQDDMWIEICKKESKKGEK